MVILSLFRLTRRFILDWVANVAKLVVFSSCFSWKRYVNSSSKAKLLYRLSFNSPIIFPNVCSFVLLSVCSSHALNGCSCVKSHIICLSVCH